MGDALRDRQMRAFLDRFVSEMPISATVPPAVIGRARRRLVITAVAAAVVVIIAITGTVSGLRTVTDADRVVPAIIGPPIPSETGRYLFDLTTRRWTPVPDIVPPRYNSPGFATVSSNGKVASVGIGTHGRQVMFVGNVDGTNVRALTKTPASKTPTDWSVIAGARFSPDGSKIAYWVMKYYGHGGNLFITDIATGQTTQLTRLKPDTDLSDIDPAAGTAGPLGMGPSYSPDGRTVFFTLPGGDGLNKVVELWSIPASGGTATLVSADAMRSLPSPDGQMIVYVRRGVAGDGIRELWLSDVDGSHARHLVTARQPVVPPAAWSPDGKRIVYAEVGQGPQGIYVVDVRTGETSKVLDEAYPIEWLDDHTWMVGVP
jgi:hypothetical protein